MVKRHSGCQRAKECPKGKAAVGDQTVVKEQKCLKGTVAIGEPKCSHSLTTTKEQKILEEHNDYQRVKNAQRAWKLPKSRNAQSKIAQRVRRLPELVITWQGNVSGGGHHKESSPESHQQ